MEKKKNGGGGGGAGAGGGAELEEEQEEVIERFFFFFFFLVSRKLIFSFFFIFFILPPPRSQPSLLKIYRDSNPDLRFHGDYLSTLQGVTVQEDNEYFGLWRRCLKQSRSFFGSG